MQLSDVPLELRAAAAVEVVWRDARLGVRERLELLGAALWPSAAAIPAEPPPAPPPSTAEVRRQARQRYQAGETISNLAEEYGQDWRTMREWTRSRG